MHRLVNTAVALSSLCVAIVFAARASAAEAPPSPTLTVGSKSITVSGVEPGTTVYVYSLSRETQRHYTTVVPREIKLVDDDRDGKVVWILDNPIALRSIWFAVDMSTGAHAVGAPPPYLPYIKQVELTSESIKKNDGGEIIQFGLRGSIVEFIVVRPKTDDVWGATVAAGGPLDESQNTNTVLLSAINLQPRLGTKEGAPRALKKDDILFMATSFKAQYAVLQVGK